MGPEDPQDAVAVEVIHLRGDFDSFAAKDLAATVGKLREEDGCHCIVLNLRLVKFINSTAIREMIRTHKSCALAGGGMAVSQPSHAICEALELLGLGRFFASHPSDEDAVASLLAKVGGNDRPD